MKIKNLHTSLRGMLLLGAYGDALGAPHEHNGLEGRIIDPELLGRLERAATFYKPGTPGDPWHVWADADAVQTMRGALTDDTSFRMLLLHPWLAQKKAEAPLTESAFRAWLHREKGRRADADYPAGLWQSRQKQITAWLDMYRASEIDQAAGFFAPDAPVVFGLFMYLDLAVLFTGCDPLEVYGVFRKFCMLDQGAAGVYAGLLSGMLTAGTGKCIPLNRFADSFVETGRDLVERAIQKADVQDRRHLQTAGETLEEMIELGRSHRSATGYEFLHAFRTRIYADENRTFNSNPPSLRNFHPQLFWMQIVSALAYAGDKPLEVLRLLAAGVGDTDTVASALGSVMGAWMGHDHIAAAAIGDTPLKDELEEIARNIRTLYGVGIEDRVEVFIRMMSNCGEQGADTEDTESL